MIKRQISCCLEQYRARGLDVAQRKRPPQTYERLLHDVFGVAAAAQDIANILSKRFDLATIKLVDKIARGLACDFATMVPNFGRRIIDRNLRLADRALDLKQCVAFRSSLEPVTDHGRKSAVSL